METNELPEDYHQTGEWKNLKFTIGGIFFNKISLSESGAIEGNPAVHAIAEFVWGKLQSLEEQLKAKDEEIANLKRIVIEYKILWNPIDEYVRPKQEVKIGDSISVKALEMIKERDSLSSENERRKNGLIKHLENCLKQPIATIGNIDYQKGYKQATSDLLGILPSFLSQSTDKPQ